MRRLVLFVLFAGAACTRTEPVKPAPTATPTAVVVKTPPKVPAAWADVADQLPPDWVGSLAFADYMVTEHGKVIDGITCHCCNKSLGECYRGTVGRQANSCPPL